MKRELKFRQPIFDKDINFKSFHYWGFNDEGFEGPASYLSNSMKGMANTQEQFTGLTDKKGKEIYEGDIIQIPDDYDDYGFMAGEKREIYFLDACFRLKPIGIQNGRGHTIDYDMDKCEVIGNIHEDKSLLND